MPRRTSKYDTQALTQLNLSVPIELKTALFSAVPPGESVSEYVVEILAKKLGVIVKRARG